MDEVIKDTNEEVLKFFHSTKSLWQSIEDENKSYLNSELLSALQMPNLLVLSGSGTSLGKVGAPSMNDLWKNVVNANEAIIKKIDYKESNVEELLSRCDAWLQINKDDEDVSDFVKKSKQIILEQCQNFLKEDNLDTHRTFLRKLSRRNIRNPRLKVFTTNYDLCFEKAAALQGLIVIDGFTFGQPRTFNPLCFNYDIVRRTRQEQGEYLEGVFHLLKLHGSVNWEYSETGIVQENTKPDPDRACLIYPAKGKYQQSYLQPHLELISQFLSSLREVDTCLIVSGFGFNDDHLSEPILTAVKSNPRFKLIIADYCAEKLTSSDDNKYWNNFGKLAKDGNDVLLINSSFEQFVNQIPDLKTLPPAQQLALAVKDVVR